MVRLVINGRGQIQAFQLTGGKNVSQLHF